MQCERFETRLQELLDQRERPECDALLLEHADACDHCRETLLLQEQMFAGLEMWEAPQPSRGFAESVVAQSATVTKASQPAALGARFPWKVLTGALAASLLIGVVTVASRWTNAPPAVPEKVNDHVVTHPPVKVAPAPTPAPDPVSEIVQAPHSPMPEGSFQEHLAVQWVENAPELLDGRNTGRMIREVTSSLPEVSGVEDNIPALRPITNGFNLTIGMMRKTLPGGRETLPREQPKPERVLKPQAEVARDGHVDVA
jgi:hypothetical protein